MKVDSVKFTMGFYIKVAAFSDKTRWAFSKLLVESVKTRVGLYTNVCEFCEN